MQQMLLELKELVRGQSHSVSEVTMIKQGLDWLYIKRRKILRRWYLQACYECERRRLNH